MYSNLHFWLLTFFDLVVKLLSIFQSHPVGGAILSHTSHPSTANLIDVSVAYLSAVSLLVPLIHSLFRCTCYGSFVCVSGSHLTSNATL